MEALKTTAIADLSLRQLARDVGVSATAVYRHFPDTAALLSALAAEGIAQMRARFPGVTVVRNPDAAKK